MIVMGLFLSWHISVNCFPSCSIEAFKSYISSHQRWENRTGTGLKVSVFSQFARSCCAQQHVGFNDRYKSPPPPPRAI